ncbi:hypothetical protein OGZ41_13190, partial [Lactococcus lactis]|nr:hypothetical protein [Lactococcus lactis]
SGNVGNHASAEMISQNVTDTGFTTVLGSKTDSGFTTVLGSKTDSGSKTVSSSKTVSGTVNTKPVITSVSFSGGYTDSKTVSGTAAPGATVDLYYATSGKVTVTADEKGNWTANLIAGLAVGNIYAWSALNGQNWIESDQVTVE